VSAFTGKMYVPQREARANFCSDCRDCGIENLRLVPHSEAVSESEAPPSHSESFGPLQVHVEIIPDSESDITEDSDSEVDDCCQ
jgi:hypothetical protein